MAKAKRKHQPHSRVTIAKKKHQEKNEGQISKTSSSSTFDQLCDNTLLRILSYADDLRSVFFLTRCTSKTLRNRFDPKKKECTSKSTLLEDQDLQCPKIWQSIFADLHMAPLDEANKSLDYFDAIGYRLSLYHTLIARDKRAKGNTAAAAKRCYSLPLRHHYFKPFPESWSLQPDDDESSFSGAGSTTLMEPFGLLSGGSGEEFVVFDPAHLSLEVRKSILENAICLDKCVQKKVAENYVYAGPNTLEETMEDSSNSDVFPGSINQTLLSTYYHSLKRRQPQRLIDADWEEYFGEGTPFFIAGRHQLYVSKMVDIAGATISTFDKMDEDRKMLVEKRIIMTRIVKDRQYLDNNVCMELAIWGGRGCNGPRSSFVLKNICRVPGEWYCGDVSSDGDHLYVTYDEDCSRIPGDSHPRTEDVKRAVFRFPLSSPLDSESYYPQPDFFLMADNNVATLLALADNLLFVGTDQNTIELWDTGSDQGQSVPRRIKTLQTDDPFSSGPDDLPLSIQNACEFGNHSLRYGFVTVQEDTVVGAIITLWQPSTLNLNEKFDVAKADFRVMARIKYDCYIEITEGANGLMVLGHDRYGCLYLDVYQVLCSRYAFQDFDKVNIPKDVEMTHLSPNGERRIHFANRIKIHHRIDVESTGIGMGIPERVVMDANDRFVVISANRGLNGSDGVQKSGTGLIVIDLDEHLN